MHTFTLVLHIYSFKLTYVEILPLLRTQRATKIDAHVKVDQVLNLIKSLPTEVLVNFLETRLGKEIPESLKTSVKTIKPLTFVNKYDSLEAYENELQEKFPNLKPIFYSENNKPLDIHKLTRDRLEYELAKFN